MLSCGVDVITTGNHVWDQRETLEFIKKQKRLLRPLNLSNDAPGNGFGIYDSIGGYKVGVLNLMGNIFMKKCLCCIFVGGGRYSLAVKKN